ncbi:restriction endonuclease subunit S [Brevundimonas diminuta]|uniref:restriction endonuclease subunit S n=1 Tax=Brevundimonas diminuta TaxID=293 RepID=UPI003D9A3CFD
MSELDDLKLPSGWTLTPVADLLKFKNGLNKGKEHFGHGTPIVNYMDVFRHAGLRRSDVHGLVDVTNAEKQAFSARKGDVLFTRTSETPEEVGISTVLLEDIENAVFSGFVLRGQPVNDRLTPEFAQYCFDSRFVRGQIVSSATYTTRALTNGRILSNVKLPLPDDPDEQQAIAAALSDADGVVAGLERVIAKKRLIKQGAMQDLLTARRRLPGFSGEWKETRLGQYGKTYGGLAGKSKQDFGVGTDSYIEFLDVINSTVILGGEFPNVRLSAGERQNKVQRNDLLFNGSSETPEEVGLCAAVMVDLESTYLNSFCFGYRLSASDQLDPIFMAALIRSGEGRDRIKHLAQGATRYNLSKRALLELELRLPSYDEQQAIAAVLSDMDAEIQTLESRLAKARAVKEGMTQNLLTGRVRLV